MTTLYLLLFLAAGVCFGLAAAKKDIHVNFLALGLLLWVIVPFLQTLQRV